jgi:hypothetical protein
VVCGSSDATLTTPDGLAAAVSAINNQACYLWWAIAAGGETTFTTTPSISDSVAMAALEYSGIAASPLDQTVSATGTTTTAGPVGPGTTAATAQAVELVVAAVGPHSYSGSLLPSSPSWSGGFTGRTAGATADTVNTGRNVALFVADLVTSSTGTQTTTVSWTNAANDWGAVLATFEGA